MAMQTVQDYIYGRPIKESYEKFCESVGENAIRFEKFKFWYDMIAEGKVEKKEIEGFFVENFILILRNDKHALRSFILCDTIRIIKPKKLNTIYEKYRQMCEIIGYDVITYQEYDFWYHRFVNGQLDVDFERNENKKMAEFGDIPLEIVESILENLDLFNKLKARNVCHHFRDIIDDSKISLHSLEIYIKEDKSTIEIDDTSFEFRQALDDCAIYRSGYLKKTIPEVCHYDMALRSCLVFFNNPKFNVKYFNIKIKSHFNAVESIFESLKHPIQAQKFEINSPRAVLTILKSLKPGLLTRIELKNKHIDDEDIIQMMNTEQWKQANHFKLESDKVFSFPIESLFHFKKFYHGRNTLTPEDIQKIKDILLKSPTFKHCFMTLEDCPNVETLRRAFGPTLPDDSDVHHYPIPDSKDYFRISFYEVELGISRESND